MLDKLPQRTVSNTSSVNSSPRLFNLQLSFDSSGNSLPSSQEEESVRKLQEKLSQDKELLELSGTSSTLSSGGSAAVELFITTHNKFSFLSNKILQDYSSMKLILLTKFLLFCLTFTILDIFRRLLPFRISVASGGTQQTSCQPPVCPSGPGPSSHRGLRLRRRQRGRPLSLLRVRPRHISVLQGKGGSI